MSMHSQTDEKVSVSRMALEMLSRAARAFAEARAGASTAAPSPFGSPVPGVADRTPAFAPVPAAPPYSAVPTAVTPGASPGDSAETVNLEGPDDGLYFVGGYRIALYEWQGALAIGLHSKVKREYEVTGMPLGTVFALHDYDGQPTRASAWRRGPLSFTVAVATTPPSGLPPLVPGSQLYGA
jgi:hypothetical protein